MTPAVKADRRRPGPTPALADEIVRCVDVAHTYGSGSTAVVAVHGTDLVVRPGDRIAVTGASGSGKSTLLMLLAGLDLPTAGSVTWPGLQIGFAGRPRDVGVVFQGPSLLPALDVRENVELPLLLADVPAAETSTRARAALAQVGVDDLAERLPEELSGGQAQRVAIARVLASRPVLILADEPTGQLDGDTADRVIGVLIAAADRLGAALVISTHDPRVARRMSVRWRMRDGRLDTAGSSL